VLLLLPQGPLAPLASSIQSVIVQAGQALQAAGHKSLGALVLHHVDNLAAAGWVSREVTWH